MLKKIGFIAAMCAAAALVPGAAIAGAAETPQIHAIAPKRIPVEHPKRIPKRIPQRIPKRIPQAHARQHHRHR